MYKKAAGPYLGDGSLFFYASTLISGAGAAYAPAAAYP